MPQSRSNKAQTPINSDAFNLTPDLATLADTLGVIVPVADRTEADAVATARAAEGWAVSNSRPLYVFRADTKGLEIKDGSGWRGAGAMTRHMELYEASFAVSGGLVNWDAGTLDVQTGQTIGTAFATSGPLSGQLTINETGWYSIHVYSCPIGNSAGASAAFIQINGSAKAVGSTTGSPAWDCTPSIPRWKFTAGDTIRIVLITTTSRDWTTTVFLDKLDN